MDVTDFRSLLNQRIDGSRNVDKTWIVVNVQQERHIVVTFAFPWEKKTR